MYYKKELTMLKECAKLQVPIDRTDRIKYQDLYKHNPQMFRFNATKKHYMDMVKWVSEGKVWREAVMGTVRHGKSEVVQTWCMFYIDVFNKCLESGVFKKLEEQGIEYKTKKLGKLKIDQILFSQSNYLYELRDKLKQDKLMLGYPRIIDEDEQSIGGLGSMSEKFEIENINNITAQTIQSEWQIRPDRFVLKNTVFGLFQEKMDRINKVNWSMLYEIRNNPASTEIFNFMGWIATPLHTDELLRKAYNKKKKDNINNVISGTSDLRLLERIKVAELISEDALFKSRSVNHKTFKLSKYQQECILNEWIVAKKVQNFNMNEKQEIVDHARMIAERKYIKKTEGDVE